MIAGRFRHDQRGASALEFALIAPAFFVFVIGIIECGLMLWTQIGMQHGAEMAARCASVNTAVCGNADAIMSYAAQQALGLSLPSSTFSVATPGCGNQVSASYVFQFPQILNVAPLTLSAQACFPS